MVVPVRRVQLAARVPPPDQGPPLGVPRMPRADLPYPREVRAPVASGPGPGGTELRDGAPRSPRAERGARELPTPREPRPQAVARRPGVRGRVAGDPDVPACEQ